MKRNFFLLTIILAMVGCVNNTQSSSSNSSTSAIVDPEHRQDTVYFNYILGQPTKAITQSLIKEGKLLTSKPVHRTYTMSLGGFSQNLGVTGYPFNLYVADKQYDAQLELFDTNGERIDSEGNLMSLHIYINGTDSHPIIEALKAQYGSPNTPPGDGYNVEVPQEVDAFWNISNKAVYLETFSSFMVLIYEDIIAMRDKNNAEKAAKQAAIDAEKQHNLEQSKNTHF